MSEAITTSDNAVHILQNAATWMDYAPAVSAVAIGTSAVVAFFGVRKTIKHQREIARQRATLDITIKLEGDPTYRNAAAVFCDVRDSQKLGELAAVAKDVNEDSDEKPKPVSQREKEEYLQVLAFLNHHELICCGIMEDTLDELFYFQWHRGVLIHYWHGAKKFIYEVRKIKGNDRIFQRFELFAESWNKDKFVTRKGKNPQYYIDNHKDITKWQD